MDNSAIVLGSMATIGLTGTIVAMKQGRSPFKPIVGALIGLVVLGGVSSFAPQVAKGLAIVALLTVGYRYGPDLFAILNGRSGSQSGGSW